MVNVANDGNCGGVSLSYRLVIVTRDRNSIQAVEQHLLNIGWDVVVTENLKTAITEAAKRNADFVFIAADHPSKLVKNLPKMIRQECKARLVGFVDTNTRTSFNALSEMHFEHVLKTMTGPAIEAMVKEITRGEFINHEKNVRIALASGQLATGQALPTAEELLADIGAVVASRKRVPLPAQQSKLAELTQQALNESVRFSGDVASAEPLGHSKRFACLFVQSIQYSGYLIAALGQDRLVDAQLMEQIRDRLFHSLQYEGTKLEDADPIHIELQEVSIENWAMHEAQFMAKAVHDAKEIAVAFFENDSAIEVSEVEEMLKVKVEEISAEFNLDFDLFVFLPANNRVIKYTHKGRRLEKDQKSRLMGRGVTHLHLKRENFSEAFQHIVQPRLNRKIRDFQSAVAA